MPNLEKGGRATTDLFASMPGQASGVAAGTAASSTPEATMARMAEVGGHQPPAHPALDSYMRQYQEDQEAVNRKLLDIEKHQGHVRHHLANMQGTLEETEAKHEGLEQLSKFEAEAFQASKRRGTPYPYFDTNPLGDVPRDWVGKYERIALNSMTKLQPENMAGWVVGFPLLVSHAANGTVRDMSQFWRKHAESARIAKAGMLTFNVNWTGQWHHTTMLTAWSIMAEAQRLELSQMGKPAIEARSAGITSQLPNGLALQLQAMGGDADGPADPPVEVEEPDGYATPDEEGEPDRRGDMDF
jgi:hypothetical protein